MLFWPLLLLLLNVPLVAQDLVTSIELSPPNPSASDCIAFRLSGTWRDGCIPLSPKVSISTGLIRIDTSNPSAVCTEALTPWALAGSIGKLPAGNYDLIVRYSNPNSPSTIEIARKSINVIGSTANNEAILPIVVNGAYAEKLHYQTIFTILNASGEIAKLGPPTQFELKIRPLEQISKYIWQMAVEQSLLDVIFPVPESFQGSVSLTADMPFAAGALNIMFPEGKFVSIPSISPVP